MIIGVIKESRPCENRVAATPGTVEPLRKLGYEVVVEVGAGEAASFPDDAYALPRMGGCGSISLRTIRRSWEAAVRCSPWAD